MLGPLILAHTRSNGALDRPKVKKIMLKSSRDMVSTSHGPPAALDPLLRFQDHAKKVKP